MTRAELQRLLDDAVAAGRITAEQAATILSGYDAGTIPITSTAEAEAIIAGLARTAPRRGGGGFIYDVGTRRYTTPSGPVPRPPRPPRGEDPRLARPPIRLPDRTMTPDFVRAVVDYAIDKGEAEIVRVTEDLRADRIKLPEWHRRMERMVSARVAATSTIALGGVNQMNASDRAAISREIAEQLKFLRGFAKDIESGKQPMDGRLIGRAKLYAQAPRGSYEAIRGRAAEFGGNNEERRVLGGADHCAASGRIPGCPQLANRWMPIGTLPRIGAAVCRSHCRCRFEYRRVA